MPPRRQSAAPGSRRPLAVGVWLLPLPGLIAALVLLGLTSTPVSWRLLGGAALVGATLGLVMLWRERTSYSMRTLASVVAALRDGDFSIRAHAGPGRHAIEALAGEINALADTLREQRLGALEASALLRTAIEELDAAIFTFDDTRRLRLANRAAERLLARPVEQLLGRTADELGLAASLEGEASRVAPMTFPGGIGRFGFRRSQFRQGGRPHQLLVVADLSRALRDEERQAWQRLLRVLGHELNNSLAPIKSVAGTLADLCRQDPPPPDWREDVRDGLALISARAEALSRFMQAYSQLARLPAPRCAPMEVGPWIERVAGLETRVPVLVRPGPPVTLHADRDQLEQLLINLVRNAADAVIEAADQGPPDRDNAIEIQWVRVGREVEVRITDTGPGLANPANLFVPFFTTKPGGSGIGLTLCRQIVEAHEGRLTLENRPDRPGCLACLRLPCPSPPSSEPG
ncbi:MAG: PAS domain-containing protein [Verrucomicrobiae bacterium]|nr:PAS domain-containing protein [Verrucomicrobiae bacterium]